MATKRKRRGERPDGRIQVTAQVGYNPDTGKPIRKSFYGSSRAEAERKRSAFLDSIRSGVDLKSSSMTVNEWIDRWIDTYGIDSETYAPYISRVKTDIGRYQINSINEAMLTTSMRSFSGKSKSGATKYRMILKQIFHKAKRNHIISDDPAEDLELPDTVEGTHRALERWEIDAIINNWRIHPAGRWAMIMLLCGLRRGEMAALQWDCIDLQNRTLTVKRSASFTSGKTIVNDHTKTDSGMRTLPICDELMHMLECVPEHDRFGFVCTSSTGSQITATIAQRNWDTYCKYVSRVLNGLKADLKGFRSDIYKISTEQENGGKISNKRELEVLYNDSFKCKPHDLRHTYATMLYMSGVDVKAAQYYLGHSDLRMTMNLYTHLTKEAENKKRTEVVGYLDRYLKDKGN